MNWKILVSVIVVLALGLGVMALQMVNTQDNYVATINDVPVRIDDLKDAQQALEDVYALDTLRIVDYGGEVKTVPFDELGVTLDVNSLSQDLVGIQSAQPRWYQPGYYARRDNEFLLDVKYHIDKDKVAERLTELGIYGLQGHTDVIEPQDSYIGYDNKLNKFVIVKEIIGNEIAEGAETLFINELEMVLQSERNNDPEIDLTSIGYYKQPALLCTDEGLNANLELFNEHLNFMITLELDAGEVLQVGPGERMKWYEFDYASENVLDGEKPFKLDEDSVREYVRELSRRVTTMGSGLGRQFKSTTQGIITVKDGNYGWWLAQERTAENIIEALQDNNSRNKTVEAVYRQKANSHEEGNDYGDTYVEISLSEQYLWYYKNGQLMLETDIVSGLPKDGRETPTGVYALTYKSRNATLRGEGYATKVSYWMPFNGDIGLHDATWQDSFGGTRYLTHGSHGCINMPYDKAKELYEMLGNQFDCVIVY